MYPQFSFLGLNIHVFGLALALGLAMFLWMAHRLAGKVQADRAFLSDNVLWFVLAGAVMARLGFFVAEWREYKFLFSEGSWFQTLFMSNYNLSLAGAIAGFAGLFWLKSGALRRRDRLAFVDVFVLSFLFAVTVGFVGALLGGQIYGVAVPAGSPWGVTYSHPATPVPGDSARFPLAIAYALVTGVVFCALYVVHVLTPVAGLVGYAGIVAFASMLLVGEFFNGNTDMFKSILFLNLNQVFAVVAIFVGLRGMLSIAKSA
jgi:prolipoprotein diacylglyceryltransferase